MPGGDRTGPAGMGPMTGRAAGFCAGFTVPGYANPVGGRGYGGWGRGFRGGGFGRGRGFGFPAAGYGIPAWGAYGAAPVAAVSAEQELADLRQQAQFTQDSLAEINQRIDQLETERKSKK